MQYHSECYFNIYVLIFPKINDIGMPVKYTTEYSRKPGGHKYVGEILYVSIQKLVVQRTFSSI